jgi:hypothetical protein
MYFILLFFCKQDMIFLFLKDAYIYIYIYQTTFGNKKNFFFLKRKVPKISLKGVCQTNH